MRCATALAALLQLTAAVACALAVAASLRGADAAADAAGPCAGHTCANSELGPAPQRPQQQQQQQRRKLAQAGWGGVQTCASQRLVIAYGANPPADISALASELESPLTAVEVRRSLRGCASRHGRKPCA
jgi:hypothetical protein